MMLHEPLLLRKYRVTGILLSRDLIRLERGSLIVAPLCLFELSVKPLAPTQLSAMIYPLFIPAVS